jgi:hypothetical protein
MDWIKKVAAVLLMPCPRNAPNYTDARYQNIYVHKSCAVIASAVPRNVGKVVQKMNFAVSDILLFHGNFHDSSLAHPVKREVHTAHVERAHLR